MLKRSLLVFVLIVLFSLHITAKTANDVIYPIEVVAYPQDTILADNFIYTIKEGVRHSSNMELKTTGSRMLIRITTIPLDKNYTEMAIAFSVVWTLKDDNSYEYFIEHISGYCGKDVYEGAAKNIIVKTDKIISVFKGGF